VVLTGKGLGSRRAIPEEDREAPGRAILEFVNFFVGAGGGGAETFGVIFHQIFARSRVLGWKGSSAEVWDPEKSLNRGAYGIDGEFAKEFGCSLPNVEKGIEWPEGREEGAGICKRLLSP